jgi:hypothetical protein
MPLAPHILAAAAWYYLFIIVPLAHYGHQKPRLHAQRERVQHAMQQAHSCLALSRLTQAELLQLAEILGIDSDEQPAGNWRFSAMERLFIALHTLSGAQAWRRAQHQWGWAYNSISMNMQQTVELIIQRLDAPDSGTCLLITARRCLLSLCSPRAVCRAAVTAYAIAGWSQDEQQEWIDVQYGPAEFRDCIGIVDATYIEVERPARYALERRLYSTYKKTHAVFFLAIVDRYGQQ